MKYELSARTTYEELFDHCWEIRKSFMNKDIVDELSTPEDIPGIMKDKFSQTTRCLVVTNTPDKDILRYMISPVTDNCIVYGQLEEKLQKIARQKDKRNISTYNLCDERELFALRSRMEHLNQQLARVMMKNIYEIYNFLGLPPFFDTKLKKYLAENFRWMAGKRN